MTKNSLTIRLSDERKHALEKLAKRLGTSQAGAVRYLIDNTKFIKNSQQDIDQLTQRVNQIEDATGLNSSTRAQGQKCAQTTKQVSAPTDGNAGAPTHMNESLETLKTADGDVAVIDDLDPNTKHKFNPFSGEDFTVVPQSVGLREGLLAGCVNWIEEHSQEDSMSISQLEKLVMQIFPDYGPDAVQDRVEGLMKKLVVYPHPKVDPLFIEQRDELLRTALTDDYHELKERGDLPACWADILGETWHTYWRGVVYFDPSVYVKSLLRSLDEFALQVVERYSSGYWNKNSIMKRRLSIQREVVRRLTEVVEERLFQLVGPGHGFDAEKYYNGVDAVVLGGLEMRESELATFTVDGNLSSVDALLCDRQIEQAKDAEAIFLPNE